MSVKWHDVATPTHFHEPGTISRQVEPTHSHACFQSDTLYNSLRSAPKAVKIWCLYTLYDEYISRILEYWLQVYNIFDILCTGENIIVEARGCGRNPQPKLLIVRVLLHNLAFYVPDTWCDVEMMMDEG